ncbi:hypothetical protein L6164_034369 [Bauhinia variegata]|uniref:Uncharacterized protein n=1 Tax=Bauhinia variegata TaxID=167791 RepID=A0ACB9KV09_BAUVA|nr:hypothetical protein L6164_034369 [Bauhinia variegata]
MQYLSLKLSVALIISANVNFPSLAHTTLVDLSLLSALLISSSRSLTCLRNIIIPTTIIPIIDSTQTGIITPRRTFLFNPSDLSEEDAVEQRIKPSAFPHKPEFPT